MSKQVFSSEEEAAEAMPIGTEVLIKMPKPEDIDPNDVGRNQNMFLQIEGVIVGYVHHGAGYILQVKHVDGHMWNYHPYWLALKNPPDDDIGWAGVAFGMAAALLGASLVKKAKVKEKIEVQETHEDIDENR